MGWFYFLINNKFYGELLNHLIAGIATFVVNGFDQVDIQ